MAGAGQNRDDNAHGAGGGAMKIRYELKQVGSQPGSRTKRSKGQRGEEGTALLEFALTLPLLLMVMTGTISFSLALYVLQQVGNSSSAATECVAAEAGTVTDPCAQIGPEIAAMLPNLTAANISYTLTVTNAAGTAATYGPFTPPAGTCTAAGSGGGASTEAAPNEPVTVTVSYQYAWLQFLNYISWNNWRNTSLSSTLSSTDTLMAE